MTQFLNNIGDYRLIRDTDTDSLFIALENARNIVVGFQDEGESAWQIALHHLEHLVADGFCKLRKHAEVVEYKRKMGFLLADALYLRNALVSFIAVDTATYAINGVGRENDNPVALEAIKNHLDVTRIGILRMNLQ